MRIFLAFLSLFMTAGSMAAEVEASLGIMVGELTESQVHIQVRLNEKGTFKGTSGKVEFRLKPVFNGKTITQSLPVNSQKDFIARATFKGLAVNTKYVCNTRIHVNGKEIVGPVARFKTLPGKVSSDDVSFVVTTGMNYAKFFHFDKVKKAKPGEKNLLHQKYSDIDQHLGYPALETILCIKPDFFVGTGDNVYYDSPDKIARTEDEIRHKYHQQFSLQRFRDLYAEVPTYWEIDDHDYRKNDCDRSGNYLPSPATGRAMMLEQLPVCAQDDEDALTYRTVRASKDLQVWFVENRMYRSNNNETDGPGKTIWGETQKKWLKDTLLASNAKYKVLVSPTPMIGPDDAYKTDNHSNTGGFTHERDEFFKWLKETGLDKNGFYIACGDRHWQYHSISKEGINEFSCGALVDANARIGRSPGDPKSNDPNATITQPYTQSEPSGGFLLVRTIDSKLSFEFYDEKGQQLYKYNTR